MDWTFLGFSIYLLVPIIVSMMGYLLISAPLAQTNPEGASKIRGHARYLVKIISSR